jgi:hypothetical protein
VRRSSDHRLNRYHWQRGLLRHCGERPHSRGAADEREELAQPPPRSGWLLVARKISYHVVARAIWNLFRKGRTHLVHGTALKSAVERKLSFGSVGAKSVHLSTADMRWTGCLVRFVP